MHRITIGIIILFIVASCENEPREPLYENGDIKIYGSKVDVKTDISVDEAKESIVTFNKLEVEKSGSLKKDSINGLFALRRNDFNTYLYLLDSFPVGQNWDYQLVDVLSWTMNNVEQPVQVLNHSLIIEQDIENLLNEVDQLRAGGLDLTTPDIELLIKKLYILNLRCCREGEERKMQASLMLKEFEKYHKLDAPNRELRDRLVGYLNKYE